jgi:hypothetical protein
MNDVALGAMVIGMLGAWLLRSVILVRRLRDRHPSVYFGQLGAPSLGQLASPAVSRSKRRLQWRMQKFIWTGEFLRLRDPVISSSVVVTLVCEVGALFVFLILLGARVK